MSEQVGACGLAELGWAGSQEEGAPQTTLPLALALELWKGPYLGRFLLPQGCKRTMAGTQLQSLGWEVVWIHCGQPEYCKVFIFLTLSCAPGPVLSTIVTET